MKSDMDLELVKKIIKITEDADISGLAIQQGDFRVEVKREKLATVIAAQPAVAHHAAAPAPSKPKDEEEEGVVAIVAPMVGTFYRAPSPDSSPYVEIGDKVEAGKTVCIIEAMKLFNEIEAEIRGEVVKIVAQDGQPVEYGQKLFLIRKG
jgi:acetyl-CoA carboxylase biotin carboxyl carrier protein